MRGRGRRRSGTFGAPAITSVHGRRPRRSHTYLSSPYCNTATDLPINSFLMLELAANGARGNANCSPLHHRHTLRTPYVHALLAARLLLLKVICPFKMYVILVNLDTEFFCISRYNVLSRCVAKYCLIESPNCMTWKSKYKRTNEASIISLTHLT